MGRGADSRGFSLIEIAIVLVVLAIIGSILYAYLGSTAKTIETLQQEKPLSQARLLADRATLASIRTALQIYYASNGRYPENKDAVGALMIPQPNFQCTGNDYSYDPTSGSVGLLIDDPSQC
jgi:prepilin-type N-terminal cleavage/methylation domain-containing protein